ncbi:EpsG family protein [Sphingobacterium olei]|uniref:EpsG family protein n=1 Tax=Sphingobacterium olei TaxID=2571155 RepID=A0A4U0PBU5_9SPHI|nr:EpsG family protein [Sphingobacterium olei]
MYYLIALFLLLLAFLEAVFKNTILKLVFFYVAFAILFVLQAFNSWSLDQENYEGHFQYIYDESVRSTLEPAHILIIESVKFFGGSYADFVFLYGGLIMLCMFFFLKRISPLPAFVVSCLYIVPFYPNILQIRFFLAFSLFLIAILNFEKRKVVFYLFFVMAICSHFSLMIMAPFFLIRKFSFYENYIKTNILIFLGAMVLVFIPAGAILPLIQIVNPKYEYYLDLVSISRFLGTIALFLPFFILSNFCLWHYKNRFKRIENRVAEKYKNLLPLTMQLIQYSNFIIIPQYFVRDFWRVSMNLSLFSFAYISICIYYGWSKNYDISKVLLSRFLIYIWVVFTFYLLFLMLNDGEYMTTIRRTIESNSVLDRLF